MRVCLVLKQGPDYGKEHAIWLAKQIHQYNPGAEIVCLTDTALDHPLIKTVPLQFPWVGWWSKLNLFSDAIDGDVFYMDVDTVIRGPIDDLLTVKKTTFLRDFYHPRLMASGVMYIAKKDKAKVWDRFVKDPAFHMAQNRTRRFLGDQGFYSRVLTDVDYWQNVRPNQIVSYKVHCGDGFLPPAPVICFHGKPRPWQAGLNWIPKL